MKNFLIIGMAAALATACGTDNQSLSTLHNTDGIYKAEAVISEVTKVEATNGGFNPQYAAIVVEGQVMIGSNRCDARGVELAVEQTVENDKIILSVHTLTPSQNLNRICTREFMPQYATFSEVVRFDTAVITDVVLKNVETQGNDVSYKAFLSNEEASETVITKVAVKSVNGGINPNYASLVVSGMVTLGSNPCVADGVKVQLTEKVVGNTLFVIALSKTPADHQNRICTMEYNPISAKVKTTVQYDRTVIKNVIIKNVNEQGNDVDALELVGGIR